MDQSKHYIWSAIGQYGTLAISFAGNVLIARALTPDDYGLIAMLALLIGLANTFTDSGFSDCLIRKKDTDSLDYSTISTFNLGSSIILYLLIFLTAPLVADFFSKPELIKVARLIGIAVIFRGLGIVPTTKMRKNLQFKSLAIMQILGSLVSLALTYTLALSGIGYWSLAWQPIFHSLVIITFPVVAGLWKPVFKFSIERFRNMAGFSLNLLLSYLMNQAENNLYSIIIGRNYSTSSLGYFNQAKRMYEIPTRGINTVVLTTSYPLIASMDELAEQRKMYIRLFKTFQTLQSILVFLLIGIAAPVWLFFLGWKWMPSVRLFNLFILTSLVYPFVTVNANIIKINNRAKLYRNLTFYRSIMHILALILCARHSLETILYGQIAASYITVIANMYYGGRIIEFGFRKQMKIFLITIIKPGTAFMIALIVCKLVHAGTYLNGIIFLGIFLILLILVYIITRDEIFFNFYHKVRIIIKNLHEE